MNKIKLLILGIAFGIAGILFVGTGIYFLSDRFLKKFNNNQQKIGKASGRFAVSIGVLTLICGTLILYMPESKNILALLYIAILIIAFCALTLVMKSNEKKK